MYSDQEVILGEMKVFISQNEDNSYLMKDDSDYVSLDPLVIISNQNKKIREEDITCKYNNRSQHVSIKTRKQGYVLQTLFSLGNLFGPDKSGAEFVNSMTNSHEFKDTWFYTLFWTENLLMS